MRSCSQWSRRSAAGRRNAALPKIRPRRHRPQPTVGVDSRNGGSSPEVAGLWIVRNLTSHVPRVLNRKCNTRLPPGGWSSRHTRGGSSPVAMECLPWPAPQPHQ